MLTTRNTSRSRWSLATLCLVATASAQAAQTTLLVSAPAPSIAFARYIASLRTRDPFQQPGFTLLTIQASLPELYKDATVVTIRRRDAAGISTYAPLALAGDGSVLIEVVDRYFELEREFTASSGGGVTPDRYKFQYLGEVKTGAAPAFVFRVSPKKPAAASFTGKIWIDRDTGAAILFSGQIGGNKHAAPLTVVRDVRTVDGVPAARLDHISFALPQLGKAEVIVTEVPVDDSMQLPEPSEKSFLGRPSFPRGFPQLDRQ